MMAGRRIRIRNTPAELRKEVRRRIVLIPREDRYRKAFEAMYAAATDPDHSYTNSQLAAIAKGLKQGLEE